MGFKASECMVIEDSIAGIKAALAAEMKVIGFLGGAHAHYPWYLEKVDRYRILIANDSSELIKILQCFLK